MKEEESNKDVWLSRLAIDNEDFLNVLIGKKLYGILMRANRFRNMWRGHSGAIGDDNAKERYNTYNEMVKEVLNLFGNFWIESPLVIPGESKKMASLIIFADLQWVLQCPYQEINIV